MYLSILPLDGVAAGEVGEPSGGGLSWQKRTIGVCGRELDVDS